MQVDNTKESEKLKEAYQLILQEKAEREQAFIKELEELSKKYNVQVGIIPAKIEIKAL